MGIRHEDVMVVSEGGAENLTKWSGSPEEPGTALVTVSGAVARPGVIEVPIGTPLRTVVERAGAAGRAAA